jgi:acetyl esterase/lipase
MAKFFLPFFLGLLFSMPSFSAPMEQPDDEMSEDAPAPAGKEDLKKAKTPKPPLEIPADIPHELDVSYLEGDRKEKADLYLPMNLTAGQKAPALILIHGGGFNDGDKRRYREINFGTNAAKRGYLAMSINYKLRKTKGQVTWPQCIYDVKEAVRWLKVNAEKYHIDPDKIGALGGSAGGNLAFMLATTGPGDGFEGEGSRTNISSKIACGVDFYGAVDLMAYKSDRARPDTNKPEMAMFNKTKAEAPDLYRRGSPTSYIRTNVVPLLMVHGTGDSTVLPNQSQLLRAKLIEAGLSCPEYTIANQAETDALVSKLSQDRNALILIPNAPHTFDFRVRMSPDKPVIMDITDLVFGWLDHSLKPEQK